MSKAEPAAPEGATAEVGTAAAAAVAAAAAADVRTDEMKAPAGMTDYQWVKQQRAELRLMRQPKVGAAAVD